MNEDLISRPGYILMVDDNAYDILFGEMALKSAAVKNDIFIAHSGEEALQILKSEKKPELVLLDLQLPGISGIQVLDYIQKSPDIARVPVIVITGSAKREDEEALYKMGQIEVVEKPFSYADVHKVLVKLGFTQLLFGPGEPSDY